MLLETTVRVDETSGGGLLSAFEQAASCSGIVTEAEVKDEKDAEAGSSRRSRAKPVGGEPKTAKRVKAGASVSCKEDAALSRANTESELMKRVLDCDTMLLQLRGCTYGVTELWPQCFGAVCGICRCLTWLHQHVGMNGQQHFSLAQRQLFVI
jgi:hypothetical protein